MHRARNRGQEAGRRLDRNTWKTARPAPVASCAVQRALTGLHSCLQVSSFSNPAIPAAKTAHTDVNRVMKNTRTGDDAGYILCSLKSLPALGSRHSEERQHFQTLPWLPYPASVSPTFSSQLALQHTVLILCCWQKANENTITFKSLLNSEHLPFPHGSLLFHTPS